MRLTQLLHTDEAKKLSNMFLTFALAVARLGIVVREAGQDSPLPPRSRARPPRQFGAAASASGAATAGAHITPASCSIATAPFKSLCWTFSVQLPVAAAKRACPV